MTMIQIDPLDADAMERLGFGMNGAALVRFQKKHPCFGVAHAQTTLAIYQHLTDLADHTVYATEDYQHLPGGNEYDGKTKNEQTGARVAAVVNVRLPDQVLKEVTPPKLKGALQDEFDKRAAEELAARQAEEDAKLTALQNTGRE